MITSRGSDPGDWNGTHIQFLHAGPSDSGKTSLWDVRTNDGSLLGEVRWFGRWRKYAFYPRGDTLFEQTCLREIAEFIEMRTREHRTGI